MFFLGWCGTPVVAKPRLGVLEMNGGDAGVEVAVDLHDVHAA